MKVIAIVQARMGSTRLPGKVLMKIIDKTVIEHILYRLSLSKMIDEIIVATSFELENISLVEVCVKNGFRVYSGSENDVLDRYYQIAKLIKPDHILRITGDCPLIDPEIIDVLIEKHIETKSDYTSNVIRETYPDGLDAEIFTFDTLEKAWYNAELKSEREHVTPYIRNNNLKFKLTGIESNIDLSQKRWTLDQIEDFEFITKIYQGIYPKNRNFGLKDILSFLEIENNLENINHAIKRNEGFIKSQENDNK